jgi:hypothetical protein
MSVCLECSEEAGRVGVLKCCCCYSDKTHIPLHSFHNHITWGLR